MVVYHPTYLYSTTRLYFNLLLSHAASMPASHGMVNSTRSNILELLDHITMSGHRLVLVISVGNWSFLSRSTLMLQSWVKRVDLCGTLGVVLVPPPPFLNKLDVMVC